MLTRTHRLRTVLMLAVAPVAPWATPALAQAQAQNDPAVLEEVIVSANRRDQALTKVPASVAVFTREKLDAQGVKSIDDIAVLTPA
jgi:iron complex outermembrane receptor protein